MDAETMEILKKHLLAAGAELAALKVLPKLEEVKAKILAKEIDPIKNMEIDNQMLAELVDLIVAQVKEALKV